MIISSHPPDNCANVYLGDIAVFQHTPAAEHIDVSCTQVTGKKVPKRSMNTSRVSENFAHLSSGDIAVFQHTPNLKEFNGNFCRGIIGKKLPEFS